jgi:hypothetical protein
VVLRHHATKTGPAAAVMSSQLANSALMLAIILLAVLELVKVIGIIPWIDVG